MTNDVQVFTYWETSPYRTTIPPYILCGIVSMQKAFGDRFTLITPANLSDEVDFDFSSKDFYFAGIPDREKDSISRITAKSDFLRFKRIYDRGGIWLDADTIILGSFLGDVDPLLDTGKLVWHSEQFFGAIAGNQLIGTGVSNMIASQRQAYANPGRIKEMVGAPEREKDIKFIPQNIWDPTGDRTYKSSDWEVGFQQDVQLDEFLKNDGCKMVKMYNSMLTTRDYSKLSVPEFLLSDALFSKLFLHIDPNIQFWIDSTDILRNQLIPFKPN